VAGTEEFARSMADAWNRMDEEAFAALFTEDVEFYLPRNLLEGGGYRGHAGVRKAMADARETWAAVTVEPRSIRDAGDRAVMQLHVTNKTHDEGPVIEYDGWFVLRFRNGLVSYLRPYLDEADALAEAGLS
jgi:ketosteroid isomerase-like protein